MKFGIGNIQKTFSDGFNLYSCRVSMTYYQYNESTVQRNYFIIKTVNLLLVKVLMMTR
jgi:hypothetical protein